MKKNKELKHFERIRDRQIKIEKFNLSRIFERATANKLNFNAKKTHKNKRKFYYIIQVILK